MVEELTSGVYDITTKEEGGRRFRAFFLDWEVPTLIDTGFEDTTEQLIAQLEEQGFEPERVIITHADGDHIGGLDAIAERYDVEVWIPQESEFDVRTTPDHRYTDGDDVGGFVALHIPGHKQDSYALVDEERSLAIMGDVVFGSDHRALPTGYLIRPPAVNSVNVNEVENNLQKLLDYEFDVALVFHGSSVLDEASTKLHDYIAFPGSRIEHP